jgi:hypothetical protein
VSVNPPRRREAAHHMRTRTRGQPQTHRRVRRDPPIMQRGHTLHRRMQLSTNDKKIDHSAIACRLGRSRNPTAHQIEPTTAREGVGLEVEITAKQPRPLQRADDARGVMQDFQVPCREPLSRPKVYGEDVQATTAHGSNPLYGKPPPQLSEAIPRCDHHASAGSRLRDAKVSSGSDSDASA